MSDDLRSRDGRDRTRINVNEEWELQYWSEKFGCSENDLRAAVNAVGTSADAVQNHLARAK